MLRIGYSNYGMRDEDIFAAIPRLRAIGYDAIELSISPGWSSAPDQLDAAARARLVDLFQALDLPPPALLGLPDPPAEADEASRNIEAFRLACELARDLNFSDGAAVITTLPGHYGPDWDAEKDRLRDDLLRLADIAVAHNVVVAIEPHIGMMLDTPEKADWLMTATRHPSIKLNFDHSQFHVMGIPMERGIELCMPHAAHIHIKDGRMLDGELQFLLPGAGDLDLVDFLRQLSATGTSLPVTVEVSGMVWNAPGYDPWATAEHCYAVVADARDRAATSA